MDAHICLLLWENWTSLFSGYFPLNCDISVKMLLASVVCTNHFYWVLGKVATFGSDPKLFSHPCLLSIWGRCCGLFLCFASLASYSPPRPSKEHSNIFLHLNRPTNKNTSLDYTFFSASIPIALLSFPANVHRSCLHPLSLLPFLPFFLLPHQSRKNSSW